MTATLATMVFVLAASISVAALAQSWAAYGRTALDLRHRLPTGDNVRELRFTILEIAPRAAGATVLRPDFRSRTQPSLQEQPLRLLPVRAAA